MAEEVINGALLQSIKLRLLGVTDTVQDALILDLIADAQSQIMSYINQDGATTLTEVPAALNWVTKDLVIKAYNRIGDEGKSSSGEGNVSASWIETNLSQYSDSLDAYRLSSLRKRPGMRFV